MSRQSEVDIIREQCRTLARKRALVSAGVAVVPVPFLDHHTRSMPLKNKKWRFIKTINCRITK